MESVTTPHPPFCCVCCSMDHFYAFYWNKDWEYPVYDRTFGDLKTVLSWVKDNKHRRAFFTVNCLPKQYYY